MAEYIEREILIKKNFYTENCNSECGKLLGEFLNYCGNCGAKMDGGDGHGT